MRVRHVLISGVTSGDTSPVYGLNFPSNGDSPSAEVSFLMTFPNSNGLPIWGPSNAGVTYLWKYKPRQHTGYYTCFFWGNDADFFWDSGSPNTYYGCHPYPPDGSSGTTHKWEIAIEGGDPTTTLAGVDREVVKNQWYVNGVRVIHNGGTKTVRYYFDLPSTTNSDVIEFTTATGYGNTQPPDPVLMWGDAPWNPQNERLSGILGPIKIFNKVLSEADMVSEAGNFTTTTTSEGFSNIWWGKKSFTDVATLVCDYGTGRAFSWTGSRAALVEI